MKITYDCCNIDWKLLREQKKDLINIITKKTPSTVSSDQINSIRGILYLIDDIQDHVVDSGAVPESVVFGNATPMETIKALEIVHGMAKNLYKVYEDMDPARDQPEAKNALDTVEGFIVNNLEKDAEDAPIKDCEHENMPDK